MADWQVRLTAEELNTLLNESFPGSPGAGPVREVRPGRVRLVLPYAPASLRPGGTISGPTMMSLADTAAYMMVMSHVGPELMALTSSLTIHFLRPALPGDLNADCELLTLGRRSAVCDVRLWTESPDRPAAQATVTYTRAREAA